MSTGQAIESTPTTPQTIRKDLGLITRREYCEATGRTERAVKRDWTLRRGPVPIRVGNEVFYRLADVRRYVNELAQKQSA